MDGSGVFMWRNLHNGGKNSRGPGAVIGTNGKARPRDLVGGEEMSFTGAEGMRDSKEEDRAIGFAKWFLRCLFFDKGLVIPPPKW